MIQDSVIRYALPLSLTGLSIATAWAIVHLGLWIAQKKDASRSVLFFDKLGHFALIIASDVLANEKPIIDSIAATGRITPADLAALKAKALDRIKFVLGKDGLLSLEDALATLAPGVESYLSGLASRSVSTAVIGTPPAVTSANP